MIRKLAVPGPIEDVEELRVLMWHGGEGTAFAKGDLIVEQTFLAQYGREAVEVNHHGR